MSVGSLICFHRRNNLDRVRADPPSKLRLLLVLGRTSNLPTVWSNCLAGWILGGAGNGVKFIALIFGATFLYVGGMFLNDAFDADFDRQHRRQRPIPAGAIAVREVWQYGFAFLLAGTIILSLLSFTSACLAILLAVSIVIYDAIHKAIAFSPIIMAGCRFLLYLIAASISVNGITGLSIWSAAALASYIVGLSFLARKESLPAGLQYWPCLFLAAPILLALLVNDGLTKKIGLILSFVLAVWILWAVQYTYRRAQRNIGVTISLLLAGIPIVDWLSVGGGTWLSGMLFLSLLVLAILFQRFIPAT